MPHPVFICFESSGHSSRSYPLAIAWTLSDGCYKSIFVKPEDSWTEWDAGIESHYGRSRDDLHQLGESGADIIRELDMDVEQGFVFSEDPEQATTLLENLFSAYNRDLPFEVHNLFELFPDLSRADFDEERRFLVESNNLNPVLAEDQILLIQRLWADFGRKNR